MRDFRAFLLDLDGVVYRGEQVLPGAREFVEWADATGRRVLYLSNNSLQSPDDVGEKLARLGMPRPQGRVLTAGWAAAQLLGQRFPGGRVFVLGVLAVERMVEQAGLHTVWRDAADADVPDAVLVGLDRSLTYERLKRALRLPMEDGFDPGTGAIATALEYASDVRAEIVGKPAPAIIQQAMRMLGVSPAETLLIGDGLDLDIVAGHAAGVTTALVLTGLTSAEQAAAAEGARKPEMIFPDMRALLAAAQAAATG